MPADEYADPKQVKEKKEKEEKVYVVQLAAYWVVHIKDAWNTLKIAIHTMTCVLQKYVHHICISLFYWFHCLIAHAQKCTGRHIYTVSCWCLSYAVT